MRSEADQPACADGLSQRQRRLEERMAVAGFIVGTALGVAVGAFTPRGEPHVRERPAGRRQAPPIVARRSA